MSFFGGSGGAANDFDDEFNFDNENDGSFVTKQGASGFFGAPSTQQSTLNPDDTQFEPLEATDAVPASVSKQDFAYESFSTTDSSKDSGKPPTSPKLKLPVVMEQDTPKFKFSSLSPRSAAEASAATKDIYSKAPSKAPPGGIGYFKHLAASMGKPVPATGIAVTKGGYANENEFSDERLASQTAAMEVTPQVDGTRGARAAVVTPATSEATPADREPPSKKVFHPFGSTAKVLFEAAPREKDEERGDRGGGGRASGTGSEKGIELASLAPPPPPPLSSQRREPASTSAGASPRSSSYFQVPQPARTLPPAVGSSETAPSMLKKFNPNPFASLVHASSVSQQHQPQPLKSALKSPASGSGSRGVPPPPPSFSTSSTSSTSSPLSVPAPARTEPPKAASRENVYPPLSLQTKVAFAPKVTFNPHPRATTTAGGSTPTASSQSQSRTTTEGEGGDRVTAPFASPSPLIKQSPATTSYHQVSSEKPSLSSRSAEVRDMRPPQFTPTATGGSRSSTSSLTAAVVTPSTPHTSGTTEHLSFAEESYRPEEGADDTHNREETDREGEEGKGGENYGEGDCVDETEGEAKQHHGEEGEGEREEHPQEREVMSTETALELCQKMTERVQELAEALETTKISATKTRDGLARAVLTASEQNCRLVMNDVMCSVAPTLADSRRKLAELKKRWADIRAANTLTDIAVVHSGIPLPSSSSSSSQPSSHASNSHEPTMTMKEEQMKKEGCESEGDEGEDSDDMQVEGGEGGEGTAEYVQHMSLKMDSQPSSQLSHSQHNVPSAVHVVEDKEGKEENEIEEEMEEEGKGWEGMRIPLWQLGLRK